jgi:hypothetical protein
LSVGLDTLVWHMLWSSLLGTASIVFMGLTGREVAGGRAGLVAAALAAVYPNLWAFDGFILSRTSDGGRVRRSPRASPRPLREWQSALRTAHDVLRLSDRTARVAEHRACER